MAWQISLAQLPINVLGNASDVAIIKNFSISNLASDDILL